MQRYYYGVQTALAYILNHFFYNTIHYTYLAGEYYPYRRNNPRSSNPHRIYEDIYEPWKDKDEYSKTINQLRINVKSGILAQAARGTIDGKLSRKLSRICDEIDVGVFYPLIYRVDIKTIPRTRLTKAGSGRIGSFEYLVSDLQESEIEDILFLDYERDDVIKQFVRSEYQYYRLHHTVLATSNTVLKKLEDRTHHYVGRTIPTTSA